ncbi:MAG TPA: Uma2 family endonuclease [Polyangiaceae bacterium]|nr:Uma2 family endonuclease [Polyangiaceae bacterium]
MAIGFSPPPASSKPARPPRSLAVVRDPSPDEVGAPIDWSSWYLTDEDDMGEGIEQQKTIEVFKTSIDELARERGWSGLHVGADTFFAWVEQEPLVRVSPDVYLLDDPPPPPMPGMIQTWLPGHKPPRFAAEIVSEDWRKDYDDGPQKYAALGAGELVIFDPDAAAAPSRRGPRVALQVYRREPDGAFVRVYAGPGPTASAELGATLVVAFEAAVARLRLARDAAGARLGPTLREAREAAERERGRERQAREAAERDREREQRAREAAERDREREQGAREAAEREMAALRAELDRLTKG